MESQKINKPHTLYIALVVTILMLSLIATSTQAQRIVEERTGNIRTEGNLAPGYLFGQKHFTAYLTGDFDLFITKNVSFVGAGWYSIPIGRDEIGLRANHAVFWGFNYHFLKTGRWDPYIGLTPGVGIVQASYQAGDAIKTTPFSPAPLVSAMVGFNYYVGSFFHFFARTQIITGQMFGDVPKVVRLDELKMSAGMGINFSVWKPRKSVSSWQ